MRINTKVTGIEKAIEKIKRYSEEKQKGVKEVIEQTASDIEQSMKDFVPVDSGITQESIRTELSESGLAARIGPKKPKGFKAHWLEFGTVKMSARPFMVPAYEKNKPEYIRRLEKELRDVQ